jgi:hypothetical protein
MLAPGCGVGRAGLVGEALAAPRTTVLWVLALDMFAGVTKETGLLLVGGSIYSVIYSCTTLFSVSGPARRPYFARARVTPLQGVSRIVPFHSSA